MDYRHNRYTSILHKSPHRMCSTCVIDASDPLIEFDEDGSCNYCASYRDYIAKPGSAEAKEEQMEALIDHLKMAGKNSEYDCVIGLSGGVDSSYLCWFAFKRMNLKPLVVHVDAGWNSELAVNNI